jgi:hypothetical protein
LLALGSITGFVLGQSNENPALGWAVFGSGISIWIVCCLLQRLARIHAALVHLRADALARESKKDEL